MILQLFMSSEVYFIDPGSEFSASRVLSSGTAPRRYWSDFETVETRLWWAETTKIVAKAVKNNSKMIGLRGYGLTPIVVVADEIGSGEYGQQAEKEFLPCSLK